MSEYRPIEIAMHQFDVVVDRAFVARIENLLNRLARIAKAVRRKFHDGITAPLSGASRLATWSNASTVAT